MAEDTAETGSKPRGSVHAGKTIEKCLVVNVVGVCVVHQKGCSRIAQDLPTDTKRSREDVADGFEALLNASTRHIDVPSAGNEARKTTIGCCDHAGAGPTCKSDVCTGNG